ncbi:uncharacterized protein LY89DRAFT_320909 [Mollisia scopiformis]|uniref:NTF2-like domain-containing protein n=1 Tax=Mollisia scopiformis TaxID=149040 RepID=A0A132BA86_MOLSC|nr:uncharacterized protein LY89DRAFT_320909 [Mollisia scopiformis]KUJ09163.1 hypothetical protein LY89DRAFT_320909 [Mollisia scopiformis]
MVSLSSLLLPLLASTVLAAPCLDDNEAIHIAKKWLDIWSSGTITKESQLTTLVTPDIQSYDGTYGQATVGIDALFASCTYVDPLVKDVVQVPIFIFHSCDQIAARWTYNALSTGVGSTVKANTPIFFHGTELLHVDLQSRLIYNSTSSADWVLLATQLGQTVNL